MPEKIITKVTDEQRSQFIKEQLPLLVAALTAAVTKFWPDKVGTIEVADAEEGIVNFDNSIITIEPTAIEYPRIGGYIERMGWLLSTWKYFPGSQHEPPGSDQVELVHCDPNRVLQHFLQHYFRLYHVEPYLDHLADEAYAKSIADEKDMF